MHKVMSCPLCSVLRNAESKAAACKCCSDTVKATNAKQKNERQLGALGDNLESSYLGETRPSKYTRIQTHVCVTWRTAELCHVAHKLNPNEFIISSNQGHGNMAIWQRVSANALLACMCVR